MTDVRLIDANALRKGLREAAMESDVSLRDVLTTIDLFPTIDAVEVVRCRECKNGAPLPEEAMAEFSPGVMRCLAGRGDCDRYCTTWEDGFCDEGVKLDAKDMDVPTKDGGATDGV